MRATQDEIDGIDSDPNVKEYRKLVDGGCVGLVIPQDRAYKGDDRGDTAWVWRLRGANNPKFPGQYADRPELAYDSPRAFAESMGAKIDEEWEMSLRPVPRRREAVMATRAKL